MYRTQCVLVLLALHIGLVQCFSWDIVVGGDKRLNFFYKGSLTYTRNLKSSTNDIITSLAYDPIHYRVFFAVIVTDSWNNTIYSFNLLNKKTQALVTWSDTTIPVRVVYDPVTQLLFWSEGNNICSLSLKNASSPNTSAAGHLLANSDEFFEDIAMDSCGGFIYWITSDQLGRIRLDGSEKEILINGKVESRQSLTIDPQTQKMYWIETIENLTNTELFIVTADLNGRNKNTLYSKEHNMYACALVVSKDFIYWKSYEKEAIFQLPKNLTYDREPKHYRSVTAIYFYLWNLQTIAANYTIEEQTQGTTSCKELKNLIYSDKPCNERLQNCTDEEWNGSKCLNYCVQGNCSVSAEGQPICSCKAGYSGERCEVDACQEHCLNNGTCSLNTENEPVCECTSEYEGERCNITITNADDKTQQEPQDLSNKVTQAIKEEIKRFLQFFSSKIDEYVGKM